MTLKDIKRLLLEEDLTMVDLSRKLHCHRVSIYEALRLGNRPRVLNRIRQFCEKNERRSA